MAENNQDLTITIKAKDQATGPIKTFQASLGKLAGSVALGTIAANALQSGFRAVTGVVTNSIHAFNESERVVAQTNAVLTSTGHAAGVSATEVINLAKAMQEQTTYSDEAVLSAENLLLTFTSIGKDIFPQATQTVLDMSTALGQDTASSAIQLGKALQDPILGVTALRRVGVNFNESQQDVIKNLVQTGQSAKAQQLIMKELATEFGGSATAAAKTFGGQVTQLKNKFDDLEEEIGHGITASLSGLLISFNQVTDGMHGNASVGRLVFDTLRFVSEAAAAAATGIAILAGEGLRLGSYFAQAAAYVFGFGSVVSDSLSYFREGISDTQASYTGFTENLIYNNQQISDRFDAMTAEAGKFKAQGPAAYQATAEEAEAAAKKINDANKAIDDTKQKISELMEAHQKDVTDARNSYGRAIVDQEKVVKDLKKQIRDEDDKDEKEKLLAEYARQKEALDSKKILETVYSTEIKEAKRRDSLTDFEREIEDITRRAGVQQKEFDRKMVMLQAELAANEEKRKKIRGIEQGITADTIIQLSARTKEVESAVNTQIALYNKLSSAASRVPTISDLAGTSSIKSKATSTKKVNDAIITPSGQVIETAPDDYIIATKNPGSGGRNTITININNPSVRNDNDLAAMKRLIDDSMRGLMRDHKLATV